MHNNHLKLFAKGFENTSMDDIAKKTGFSRALLYVYFKDKKDIYHALRVRAVGLMRERMIEYSQKVDTSAEKVEAVGRAFYDFYRYDNDYFDCLSLSITMNNQNAAADQAKDNLDESLEAEKSTMQVMLDALATGIQDGTLDPAKIAEPLETAMFLRGSLHGVILLQDRDGNALMNKAGIDGEQMVIRAIDRVTASLKPTSE